MAGSIAVAASIGPRWLAARGFEHPAQQIVFQDAVDAIEDCASRLQRHEEQLHAIVPNWSMAPVVAAYQAMRGVSFVVAVTFLAEIGDVRRFENPRQPMAFIGLVPSERSTGDNLRRAGLTLAGNRRARRALVEGAWTYRYQARVSAKLQKRLEGIPKPVRDIAWKAQVRLCGRFRRLAAIGKEPGLCIGRRAVRWRYYSAQRRHQQPGPGQHRQWHLHVRDHAEGRDPRLGLRATKRGLRRRASCRRDRKRSGFPPTASCSTAEGRYAFMNGKSAFPGINTPPSAPSVLGGQHWSARVLRNKRHCDKFDLNRPVIRWMLVEVVL
jgi:Transposase IS116/IS110/IS902 family